MNPNNQARLQQEKKQNHFIATSILLCVPVQVYGGWTATYLLHTMSMTNGSQNWESKPTMRIHVQIVPSLGLSGLKRGSPLRAGEAEACNKTLQAF